MPDQEALVHPILLWQHAAIYLPQHIWEVGSATVDGAILGTSVPCKEKAGRN